MSVMAIIYGIITFCILMFFFNFMRIFIFSHLKVGVFSLQPSGIWLRIWYYFNLVLTVIFIWIVATIFVLWIIWHIIKKYVPNRPIPLRSIFLKIPPFPQLTAARIFSLYDAGWNIFLGKSSFGDRLINYGKEIGQFIAVNTDLALDVIGVKKGVEKIKQLSREEASIQPESEAKRGGSVRPPPPPYEKSDEHTIDDQYQQCLEENVIPITEDMEDKDKRAAEVKNTATATTCKIKTFQAYAKLLEFRM